MNRLATLALLLLAGAAPAQDAKPLRWGCDPTGGAPFIYQDAAGNYVGFEVEFADYLAKAVGRKSELVAGDWSNLPLLLGKPADGPEGIDVVLNGYEYQPDLAAKYRASRPYYVYRQALMARRDDAEVRGWADLLGQYHQGRRKSVGVLGGSACERHVRSAYGASAEVLVSQDVATVIKLVDDRRLDATVQDTPAATYYLKEHPNLHLAGEPIKPGFYVVYSRRDDPHNAGLADAIDVAIAAGVRDGTLRRIYQKYGLWNDDQERLYWADRPWPPPLAADEAEGGNASTQRPLGELAWELLRAAVVTVGLTLASFPLAMMIGIIVAIGRVYGPRWLAIPLGVYVEVLRGTPLLLQLFMIYYLVPQLFAASGVDFLAYLGKNLTPFAAGVIGLAVNYSAYEAENYRAGLLAIPRGQLEAAESLGMTRLTAVRRVVAPQALRLVIPPVTNDFIALFKDTAACSIILVSELTRKYNELFNFNRGLIIELAFLTAGLYLAMSYPLALAAARLERRLANPPTGGKP